MGFEKYQKDVDIRISQFKDGYWNNDRKFRQMTEELGEIAKVISYIDGSKKPKEGEIIESLEAEIADLLFSIICMANDNKIDLDKAFTEMMDKKRWKRDNNRFEKK